MVPLGTFLGWYRILKFSFRKHSGIPEYFSTLNETGKQPVLNAGTESGPGNRMFPNARDEKFPRFFPEISGSQEMPFGNADLYPGPPKNFLQTPKNVTLIT